MNVQRACEAPNIASYQMRSSFGDHRTKPGEITLQEQTRFKIRAKLRLMGYKINYKEKTSGPITAIFIDQNNGTLWGGASNYGEDHGIAW